MVTLHTNRQEFFNDIAEVIRSFLGFVPIMEGAFEAQSDALCMNVQLDGRTIAQAYDNGNLYTWQSDVSEKPLPQSDMLRKREEKRLLKIATYRLMQQVCPHKSLPWGALTGIRPTKLLRELMETEGEPEALRMFAQDFDVKGEKLRLAHEIINVQTPFLQRLSSKDADVYVGIPYCKTRCLYCSFASSVAGKEGVPQVYFDALFEDIRLGASLLREGGFRARALYVGGGTPTTLSAPQLDALLAHIYDCYGDFEEITVEAGRPDTVDREKLMLLQTRGVGRISLNPQSMNAQTLERIGRNHTPEELEQTYALARSLGFSNINMDIIAGLPGETLQDFCETLSKIEKLRPESLTIHTLAVKRSSKLKERLEEYPLPPEPEVERMLYEGACCAAHMGLRPYYMYRQKYMRGNLENVGYALPGFECAYNIDMMEEATSILAHGANAMTKCVFEGRDMRVERIPAPKDVATYIAKLPILQARKRELFLG